MYHLDLPQNKNSMGMRTDGFDVKSRMVSQNSIVCEGQVGGVLEEVSSPMCMRVHVHTRTEVGDAHPSLFFSILLSETRSLTHPGADHVG